MGHGLRKCFVNTYISRFLVYWLWQWCFIDYKVYCEPGFGVLTGSCRILVFVLVSRVVFARCVLGDDF